MAREVINIGTRQNDRTGDSWRVAATKINNMTDELYAATAGIPDVANILTVDDLVTNLTTTTPGSPLDATMGKSLKDQFDALTAGGGIPPIANNLTTTTTGSTLDATQGKILKDLVDKSLRFATRAAAVGADVGAAEFVMCMACTSAGPDIPMFFEVSAGTAGGANDDADRLAGKIQFAGSKFGTLVPIGNAYWAEWFGARPNDSGFDSAPAINAAVAIASESSPGDNHNTGSVDRSRYGVRLGPGLYYTSSTVSLEVGPGFRGSWLEGSGSETTVIVFSPAAIGTPAIQVRGGSGNSTNKRLGYLSITRNSTAVTSTCGRGVLIQDQCFFKAVDLLINGFAVGYELANVGSGGFTEFNELRNSRIMGCTRAVQFQRRGGNDSFHGNEFHNVQLQLTNGGFGLYLGGASIDGSASTGSCFVYGCRFFLRMFGVSTSSSLTTGIYHDNINTDGNIGDIQCENQMTFTSAGTGAGFALDGLLYGLHGFVWGANSGHSMFRFRRVSVSKTPQNRGVAFASSTLAAFNPGFPGNIGAVDKTNTLAPAIIPMSGSNRESMTVVVYPESGSYENGLYLSTAAFGVTDPKDVIPRWWVRADGQVMGTFNNTLVMREMGALGSDQQLFVNNGRFGGRMGRLPPVTSVSSSGSAQTIGLWTNNNTARSSEFYLRIVSTTAGSLDRYIRGSFVRGPTGATGDVVIFREHDFINTTAGAVSASTFAVTTAGQLTMTITTDRALTISGWEFSGGEIQTV